MSVYASPTTLTEIDIAALLFALYSELNAYEY